MLLGSTRQGTGIDQWSAGVILLSMMSRCHPFFKAEDSACGLVEIMTVCGNGRTEEENREMEGDELIRSDVIDIDGRRCIFDNRPPSSRSFDLDDFIRSHSGIDWPPPLLSLMHRLLAVDPARRITAASALQLPWAAEDYANTEHIVCISSGVAASKAKAKKR